MWWLNDRNFHLHQQLLADNNNLSSHLHRASSAACSVELPGEYNNSCLPDTSSS
jgi:hypothetical protein